MSRVPTLLVTRPEPEASATVEAARAAGFAALAAPLLAIRPLAPASVPPAVPDAVLLTSARSAQLLRAALPALPAATPVFAVGPSTAEAARAAGFTRVRATGTDGQAALAAAVAAGHVRILHARGTAHRPLAVPAGVRLEPLALYRAVAARTLPVAARAALAAGAVTLLFSPRTASLFRRLAEQAGLAPEGLAIAALSAAVAEAAGPGWREVAIAAAPRTAEILAVAGRMWQGGRGGADG